MRIHIEALTFEVIIGLLDFEREHPQQVIIDMELDYHYTHQCFINYADIVVLIEKELNTKKYILLEEALEGVHTLLMTHYPSIERLQLKITKPDILPHCRVALSKEWIF